MSSTRPVVGFLGLSHLGIVSAISLASKKVNCIGVDLNHKLVNNLSNQKWPIKEPGMDEVYIDSKNFLFFDSNLAALAKCDIVYISQDVPTNNEGKSDLAIIENLICEAAQNILPESLIIILCQVPPGFSRKMQKYHKNLYYQVETLVFGQAFERAIFPERIIVGAEDPCVPISADFQIVLDKFSCPILLMDYESAEFTKISINAFLAASITTTNELNRIGNSVGAKWDNVKEALKLDKRIGPYAYLKPGLGISGGNIERDLQTLDDLDQKESGGVGLFRTYTSHSKAQKNWIFNVISDDILRTNRKARIGILGVTYKENTNSTKNSIALEVIFKFSENIVGIHDPYAELPQELAGLKRFSSAQECILSSDVVAIMTPWKEFYEIDLRKIPKEKLSSLIFIDPYGILDHSSIPKEVTVRGLN